MKILPLITCFCLFSSWGFANDEVPQIVKDAFAQLYPEINAPDIYWEYSKDGVIATFQDHGRLTKAYFDESGKWNESRIRLYLDQLPLPIRTLLEKKYRNVDITFMGKVLFPDGSYIFRIESEYYEEVVINLMDKQGVLLQEQRIPFTEGLEVY
ncbi:MAG: PepSY-like domain-containing protein [Lewinellaceae bacterium]|nr:PepSY-like domain-containing protein [Lewinellaceae bacterium]